MSELDRKLSVYIKSIEDAMKIYLKEEKDCRQVHIYDAVQYSALSGGKRLRPVLTLEFCRACGGNVETALPFAAALEMIHTYSLIHDDLPCMDDDDLRRGRPTNHKVYGEALAVLAGDALLTRAFETALDSRYTGELSAETVLRAASALAKAAGMEGMIGGQVIDMEAEGHALDISELEMLQSLKTDALIRAAAQMGCILGGASPQQMQAAELYASRIGLAFQIEDDLLDIEGDEAVFGKPVGSDNVNGKCTYPSLLGVQECHTLVQKLTDEAIEAVAVFDDPSFLTSLAEQLVVRDH